MWAKSGLFDRCVDKIHSIRLRRYLGYALWKLRTLYLKNPYRELKIKSFQRDLLKRKYPPDAKKLIIFLTPGYDTITGGILSISSIYNETLKLKHLHGAETIMCTVPGDPLLLKYTKFHNNNFIYSFSEVLSYFSDLESLLIHIPEYAVKQFIANCFKNNNFMKKISKLKSLHINLMLQNIDLAPSVNDIRLLKKLPNLKKLTCTTAHEAYSTDEIQKRLECELHKLSVYVSPEQYYRTPYKEKENLMIVSPDYHPKKPKILKILSEQLPNLRILIIRNLSYEEYKNIISKAKWSLTFGEGLDGYFVETIFSGGVSFAVYNERFFTRDFMSLRTVYPSYGVLEENIVSDIKELDNEESYSEYQNIQFTLCAKYYNYKRYIDNLTSFYQKYFAQ